MEHFIQQVELFIEKYREHYPNNKEVWDELRWRLERVIDRLGPAGQELNQRLKTETELIRAMQDLQEWENAFTEVLVSGKFDMSENATSTTPMPSITKGLKDFTPKPATAYEVEMARIFAEHALRKAQIEHEGMIAQASRQHIEEKLAQVNRQHIAVVATDRG